MSPPIRDGSGNSIGSIRLGDGTEIAEVRTGAGDVLFSAIPDSVVSRPADNNQGSLTGKFGVRINSDVKWPSIGAELSSNYSGGSTAYIYRVSDGQLKGQTDISGLAAGDTFTIKNVNLAANTDYNFVLDNNGSVFSNGNFDSPSLPITSSDGDLSIINGGAGKQSTSGSLSNFVRVGNVGF
jgi:hypothetical protein